MAVVALSYAGVVIALLAGGITTYDEAGVGHGHPAAGVPGGIAHRRRNAGPTGRAISRRTGA